VAARALQCEVEIDWNFWRGFSRFEPLTIFLGFFFRRAARLTAKRPTKKGQSKSQGKRSGALKN
jgi:hypothetical protein